MTRGEGAELRALEIEDADAAVLDEQRDHQLRPHVVDHGDVTRVGRDVVDEHDFLVQRRVADQPAADVDRQHVRLLAVLQRHFRLQLLRRVVDEQDAEGAVVDHPPGEHRDAAQELVEVENRRDLARDLGQSFERRGVFALALEQAGVGDRLGDVDAELRQDFLVALRERARPGR